MSVYPVVSSGYRMPIGADGTRVFRRLETGALYEFPPEYVALLQTPGYDMTLGVPETLSALPQKLTFVFPEPRDLVSLFIAAGSVGSAGTSTYSHGVGTVYDPSTSSAVFTPIRFEVSTDTTNGLDGSWSLRQALGGNPLGVTGYQINPANTEYMYRFIPNLVVANGPGESITIGTDGGNFNYQYNVFNTIASLSRSRLATLSGGPLTGLRGVRIFLEASLDPPSDMTTPNSLGKPYGSNLSPNGWLVQTCHLYGKYSATVSDRLEFWHPTSNVALSASDVDQGDIQIDSSQVINFRLKNRSPSKTAQDISLGVDLPLPDASPSLLSQLEFSLDGVSYSSGIALDSLAPGAISSLLRVRRTTPGDAQLSAFSMRISYQVGGWV